MNEFRVGYCPGLFASNNASSFLPQARRLKLQPFRIQEAV